MAARACFAPLKSAAQMPWLRGLPILDTIAELCGLSLSARCWRHRRDFSHGGLCHGPCLSFNAVAFGIIAGVRHRAGTRSCEPAIAGERCSSKRCFQEGKRIGLRQEELGVGRLDLRYKRQHLALSRYSGLKRAVHSASITEWRLSKTRRRKFLCNRLSRSALSWRR